MSTDFDPITLKKLRAFNRQLKKHGGSENCINLSDLGRAEVNFLKDLATTQMARIQDRAARLLKEFYDGDKSIRANIHRLEVPTDFNSESEWEIVIGETFFGSPQVIIHLTGWNIDNCAIVG